jgi:hypothetical protein
MKTFEKVIHHSLVALIFSIINWLIIDSFIIKISFIMYFILEIILAISLKICKFTIQKLNLN